ncbi:deoxyhypusine synthase, partial [Candidatus Micrarchaeota archaeon CG1_02_55_22]
TTAAQLVDGFASMGLQASELAAAAGIMREMRREKAVVFLSFTSNMVSSGLREVIAQLCREKRVDAIVTSIGSVEEDLMKSWKGFELGSFDADDAELNKRGINRIGNIHVSNAHYEWLERFLQPFFAEQLKKNKGKPLAPHKLIADLGERIDDKNSFVYWASKNKIPVFCPAPTDGAFGLQTYFFKQDHPEFAIDVTADQPALANLVLTAKKTGALLLGGGFAKHHVIGANLLRGGLDYAVYVTTASEYDGSLSGARTKEAVSWGKIRKGAKTAYVQCDASIALPLLVAATA